MPRPSQAVSVTAGHAVVHVSARGVFFWSCASFILYGPSHEREGSFLLVLREFHPLRSLSNTECWHCSPFTHTPTPHSLPLYSSLSSSWTRCRMACLDVSCTSPARKNSSRIM